VHLQGAINHPRGHLRRSHLDESDVVPRSLDAARVNFTRGLEAQEAALIDHETRLGDVRANRALRGEGLAEGDALVGACAQEG